MQGAAELHVLACQGPASQSACANATNPGRTYRFFTGEAVLPFGFGLSYSSFSYGVQAVDAATRLPLPDQAAAVSLNGVRDLVSDLEARNRTFFEQAMLDAAAPAVVYQINVTNTGAVAAADAVLGFLTPPGAGVDGVPLKALFGFEHVRLQ